MSDQNDDNGEAVYRDDNSVIHADGNIEAYNLTAQSIEESELTVDSVEENTLTADSVSESTVSGKPDFDVKPSLLGRAGQGVAVTSSGPQVDYVNKALGVDANEYTLETMRAVKDWQGKNNLSRTGRVNAAMYEML